MCVRTLVVQYGTRTHTLYSMYTCTHIHVQVYIFVHWYYIYVPHVRIVHFDRSCTVPTVING